MKVEKQSNDDLFDYESKYESENKMKETFPEINEELKNILEENTQKIYNYFGIKGMCRIDYLVMDNQAYFLEINTIP
jgi:D-alanine-D-alanine ligase